MAHTIIEIYSYAKSSRGNNVYGKIFESIYDGTLVEDWRALITFQQFIVLSDADGVVDMTPQAISRRTGIPIDHIKAGIEVLEKTDKYSRTPDQNGCRIELIDDHRPWGWHIVNHEKYKKMQDSDTIRAQTRARVQRHRNMKKTVTDGNVLKRTVTDGNAQKRYTDTDTDTNTKIKTKGRFARPSLQDIQDYCQQRENLVNPQDFLDHYQANGWFRGKTKIKDWKACVRTWEKTSKAVKTVTTDIMMMAKQKKLTPKVGESMDDFTRRVRTTRE